jgi:hypothetical protein
MLAYAMLTGGPRAGAKRCPRDVRVERRVSPRSRHQNRGPWLFQVRRPWDDRQPSRVGAGISVICLYASESISPPKHLRIRRIHRPRKCTVTAGYLRQRKKTSVARVRTGACKGKEAIRNNQIAWCDGGGEMSLRHLSRIHCGEPCGDSALISFCILNASLTAATIRA